MSRRRPTIAWPAEADTIMLRATLECPQMLHVGLRVAAYESSAYPGQVVVWDEAVAEWCNTLNQRQAHPLNFEFTRAAVQSRRGSRDWKRYLLDQKLSGYPAVPHDELPSEGYIQYHQDANGQMRQIWPPPQNEHQEEGHVKKEEDHVKKEEEDYSIPHRYVRRAQRAGLSDRSTARYFGSSL
ncbi:hypothetical protein JCM8547_005656 [Rhodosporidiobolus lusitaniae]